MVPSHPQSSPVQSAPEVEREASPLLVINFLLANTRHVFTIPLVLALVAGLLTFLFAHRNWESTASFMPQAAQKDPGASIAEDFGVDIGGEDKQNSPAFYVSLLKSRAILSQLALAEYRFRDGKDSLHGNLMDLNEIKGKNPSLRREDMLKELGKTVVPEADIRTGIVKVSVRARWAPLAKAMAEKLLADVNDFNLRIRQTKARSEREFIQTQVADARVDLRASEDQLQAFSLRNREYAGDPRLMAEHDRIIRELSLHSLRYSTLVNRLDQAAIDAVRTTPVITILERPELPVKPLGRGTVLRTALVFVMTAILGALFVLFRDYARDRDQSGAADYHEFKLLSLGLRDRIVGFFRRRPKKELR